MPQFTNLIQDQTVWEGEDVVLRCQVDPDDSPVIWQLNNMPVTQGDKYTMSNQGAIRTLTIHKAQKADCGSIVAIAGSVQSEAQLTVKGSFVKTIMYLLIFLSK